MTYRRGPLVGGGRARGTDSLPASRRPRRPRVHRERPDRFDRARGRPHRHPCRRSPADTRPRLPAASDAAGEVPLEEHQVAPRHRAARSDQPGFWERYGYHNDADPWASSGTASEPAGTRLGVARGPPTLNDADPFAEQRYGFSSAPADEEGSLDRGTAQTALPQGPFSLRWGNPWFPHGPPLLQTPQTESSSPSLPPGKARLRRQSKSLSNGGCTNAEGPAEPAPRIGNRAAGLLTSCRPCRACRRRPPLPSPGPRRRSPRW